MRNIIRKIAPVKIGGEIMDSFGALVAVVLCAALVTFLIVAITNFFQAPIVVQTEPAILRIKVGWSEKIEAGYYYLGDKVEREVIFALPINQTEDK